jgi:hypothetical protein
VYFLPEIIAFSFAALPFVLLIPFTLFFLVYIFVGIGVANQINIG